MEMLCQAFHFVLMEAAKSCQFQCLLPCTTLPVSVVVRPQAICHQALLSPPVAGWDGHQLGEPLAD